MAAPRARKRKPRGLGRALVVGERVFLRRPAAGDCEEIIQRSRDSRRLWAAWARGITTPQRWAEYLRRGRRHNCVLTIVCRLDDGAIVGAINLNEIVRGLTQMAYIGYCGFRPFDGQGYMTEGLDLMLRHAFVTLKLHRVEAGIQPGNERSIALVKRLGFRCEGTAKRLIKIAGRWRDHERWAILAEEWRACRGRTKKSRRDRSR